MKRILLASILSFVFYCTRAQITFVNPAAVGLNNGTSWINAYTNLQNALTNTSSGSIWVVAGTHYPGVSGNNGATFALKNGVQLLGGFIGNESGPTQRDPVLNPTILSGDLDVSGNWTGNDAYHVVTVQDVNSSAVLDGFVITGGNAPSPQRGGGVYCNVTTSGTFDPIIRNCDIRNNYGDHGGGVEVFSWYIAFGYNSPQFLNCKIHHNKAFGWGGGVHISISGANAYGAPRFENVMIYNDTSQTGGAVGSEHANGGRIDAVFNNCTFANNPASYDIVYMTYSTPGSFTFNNSIVYGMECYTDDYFSGDNNILDATTSIGNGGGNVVMDPIFMNAGAGNFQLRCNSPCINAGSNAYSTEAYDVSGAPRISQLIVDIGAYETNYTPPVIGVTGTSSNICVGDSAILNGTGALSYVWDNGVIDGVTFLPVSSNTYNVTGTDANGCIGTAMATINIHPIPTVVANSASTDVCAGTSIQLYGSGATFYSWDNGVTNNFPFTPAVTTTYQVIGTTFGCSDTASITITVHALPTFSLGPDQSICETDSILLQATISNGTPPFIYNWSNGATISTANNEMYVPAATENISLQVADMYGCLGNDVMQVTVDASEMLSGTIHVGAGTLSDGVMYVFRYIPQQMVFDTMFVNPFSAGTGTYSFPSFPFGNYLIKIIPDTLIFPNLLPTYYGDAFQWDSATVITHNCTFPFVADINMIALLGGTGTGSISGEILEGDGFGSRMASGHHHVMAPGGPLKGVDVKLGKNPGGGIQARTVSDSTGHYEFNNLPDDSYRIYVDIPGLPMDSFYVVNVQADSTIDLDYYADSNSVFPILPTAVGSHSYLSNTSNFEVYPNPAHNAASVKFELVTENAANIRLMDITGKQLMNIQLNRLPKGKHEYQLNFANQQLQSGVYFIQVMSGTGMQVKKLIIE